MLKSNSPISQRISHLAFGAFIISILINGIFSKEFDTNMKVGEEAKFANKSIKFEKINILEKNNYKSIKGTFKVQGLDNNEIFF